MARILFLSPNSLRLAALLLVNSLVRGFGALAAVVLAAGLGTSKAMDLFTASSMAITSGCLLAAIAVPALMASYVTKGGSHETVVARAWARKLSVHVGGGFLLAIPFLAYLLARERSDQLTVALLLLLGAGNVWFAPQESVEQTLHQQAGRQFYAQGGTAVFLAVSLAGAWTSSLAGSPLWATASLSLGSVGALWWLRQGNQSTPAPSPSFVIPAVPWRRFVGFTAACAAAFLVPVLDQLFLARIGAGAQAVWGLANKPASFLTMSVFAVTAAMTSQLLMGGRPLAEQRRALRRLCGLSLVLTAGILTVLWVFAAPLTALLYERGAFSSSDTLVTAEAARITVWTFVLYPLSAILVRAASAHGGTRLLLWSTALFVAVKLGVGLALLPTMGIWAVALSTAAATLAQSAILWRIVRSPPPI